MFGFITSFLLLFAEASHGGESGAMKFYNDYLNVAGFEVWKFINLAIFIAAMVYLLKKPLSGAFKTRREAIRSELIKAEQEKQSALVKLTSAEAQLAQMETQKSEILEKAKEEVAAEKKRLAAQTKADAERLRLQAEAELTRIANQSRAELRRFSAEESIRLAEEKLRSQIDGAKDAKLVKANIAEIGGLN
jgi:F0F1-type ATP synthase membrane subunit b/b'